MKYYTVVVGRCPGIYNTWSEAEKQVKGFPGAIFKSFANEQQAAAFISNSTSNRVESNTVPQTTPLPDKTLIYTDGGYSNGRSGFGVVILTETGDKYTAYGAVPLTITQGSDIAELYAIYVALSLVKTNVLLYSDSRYAVDALSTRIHDWVANGWQGVANQSLLTAIYTLMHDRTIQFQYIPAHSGYLYNEETDNLATLGKNTTEQLVLLLNGQRIQ